MANSNPTLDGLTEAISQAAPLMDRKVCETAAIAALRALRDPAPEILEAAFPRISYNGYAREDWQAIIDAILKTGAEKAVSRTCSGAR